MNGVLHNDKGPSVRYLTGIYAKVYPKGEGPWYYKGCRHRLGGPAKITNKGIKEYYIFDLQVSEQEHDDLNQEISNWLLTPQELRDVVLKSRNKMIDPKLENVMIVPYRLQCKRCSQITGYVLDLTAFDHESDERPMGPETMCYQTCKEICSVCDETFEVEFTIWAYPPGCYNHHTIDTTNCKILNEDVLAHKILEELFFELND